MFERIGELPQHKQTHRNDGTVTDQRRKRVKQGFLPTLGERLRDEIGLEWTRLCRRGDTIADALNEMKPLA